MGPLALGDKTYLKPRRGKDRSGTRRYVCVPVPKKLQGKLGNRTVDIALNADSFSEAQGPHYEVVAKIKALFKPAREGTLT
jgi:hypothetical protein